MKIERVPATVNPAEPGIYACRQYYGWRILEWHDGAWWHVGRSAKWPIAATGNKMGIDSYIGPLPLISADFMQSPLADGLRNPTALEFDL